MSVEIAWKQNILVTDFHLLKSPLVVFGFGLQAFVCGFSRQNINSVEISESAMFCFSRCFLINLRYIHKVTKKNPAVRMRLKSFTNRRRIKYCVM